VGDETPLRSAARCSADRREHPESAAETAGPVCCARSSPARRASWWRASPTATGGAGPGPLGPDRPPSGVYCPESADFRLYTAGENAYDPPAVDAAM